MFSIEEILDIAIQLEKNGENVYQKAATVKRDPTMGLLLQRLADDEAKHAQWFMDMKKSVGKDIVYPQLEEMGRKILKKAVGDQAFTLGEADLSKVRDSRRLIELALEFEKDTVIFFEMIGNFVNDQDTLSHLNEIIEEENRHVSLLQKLLDNDVK
ncbi:ferritin family protein [Thermodesulfobacteriota bacterium]